MRAPPRHCSGVVAGAHDARHDRLHTRLIGLACRPGHAVETTTLHAESARRRARSAKVARSIPGLHAKVTRCPGGSGCDGVASSAWYASAQRDGAGIVHGNGFSARAYVGVVAFRSPRGARHFVRHVRQEHGRYEGVFSVALKPGRGDAYTPGERGVGSIASTHRRGWSGWVLDARSLTELRHYVPAWGRLVAALGG
jgi:hypothetical protein